MNARVYIDFLAGTISYYVGDESLTVSEHLSRGVAFKTFKNVEFHVLKTRRGWKAFAYPVINGDTQYELEEPVAVSTSKD